MITRTILVSLLLASALSLYDEDSAVFKLTAPNFKSMVLDSE